MPPVGTMMLVLPALSASRTSIQVISSSHTVFGAGRGLAASTQLYGFWAHCPPPMSRGSGSRRCRWPCCAPAAPGCCAATYVPANTVTLNAISAIFFIETSYLTCSFNSECAVVHALAELAVAIAASGAERCQRCLCGIHAAEAEIDQDRVGVLLRLRGDVHRFRVALGLPEGFRVG